MAIKKLLTYEGLEEYNIKWHERLQAMLMSDEEIDGIWEELFPTPVLWSFTVDTEATRSDAKKTGVPFNLNGQNVSLTVDWGDGTQSLLTSANFTQENDATASIHEYAEPGVYQVTISSTDWSNAYPISIDGGMYIEYVDDSSRFLQLWRETLVAVNSPLPAMKGMYLGNWDIWPTTPKDNSLNSLFALCEHLASVPANLFENCSHVTDLRACFYYCSALSSIPTGLLDDMTELTDVDTLFCECPFTSLPPELFTNNTKISTFRGCFSGCSSLAFVPEGLFDNNTAATDFGICFSDCSSLTDFTLHIGSSLVSNCSNFVTNKSGTTRTIYVPSGSTTQTTFNAQASSLGLTIIGE